MPKLRSLTVTQLKAILSEHGASSAGNKAELVIRLTDILESDEIDSAVLANILQTVDGSIQAQINELKNMLASMATTVAAQGRAQVPQSTATQSRPVSPSQTQATENNPVSVHPSAVGSCNGSIVDGEDGDGESANRKAYSIKEIADTIPEFDPTNETSISVEQFIQHIESVRDTYGFGTKPLLLAIHGRLRGVARLWLDAQTNLFQNWRDFKNELLYEFGMELNEEEVHYKMANAFRRHDEDLLEYCFRISAIGKKYQLTEAAIVKYARDGFRNRELQNLIACINISTMRELRDIIMEFLANRQTLHKDDRSSSNKTSLFRPQQREQTKADEKVKTEFECYNCHKFGHMAKHCRMPQRKSRCATCQRTTHKTEECPEVTTNRNAKKSVNKIGNFEDTYPEVVKPIEVNGKKLKAFMDTGSSVSLIRYTFSDIVGERMKCHKVLSDFAGGEYVAKEKIVATIVMDGTSTQAELLIVDDQDLPEEVLLGRDVLCGEGKRFIVEQSKCYVEKVSKIFNDHTLSSDQQSALDALIKRNQHCFASNVAELGACSTEEFKISLTTDQPVNLKPYRVAFPKRKFVASIIQELLDHGIIRKSQSSYASPVVLIEKKNGEHRLCVDYRALNKITVKTPFPMPILEEQFGELAGNNYFTSLDLRMGYHQILVHPDSISYTAFITTEGHYEFMRMPFGLVNAPAVFQRLMNQVISEMPRGEAMAYLDDVIIASSTIGEGLRRLESFLGILAKHGLTLRQDKCTFFQPKIEHLGHIVSADGIQPGQRKIKAIQYFEPPKSITEVRRFLGLTGFFRKFVADYALISKPIIGLLRINQPFHWGEEQQRAFDKLIEILTNAPVLALYDAKLNHQVHTDACIVGLAGMLLQSHDEKNWRPVMYFSRHCTEAEQKYHSHELEVLAIVETLERFKIYLQGKFFRVVTDCEAVARTKTQKELKPRIARWWMKILEFDFEIVHRAGSRLAHVDAMSRAPVEPSVEVEPAGMVNVVTETDWIAAMQHRDERIRWIINVVTGQIASPEAAQLKREYTVKNHRLYRKIGCEEKLVVPKLVRLSLVKHYHDNMGHFSTEKTLQRLQKWFWFPKMRKQVKSYVLSCIACCYNKAQRTKTEGEMHYEDPIPIPFRVLHIDHLGPFIKSRKGNMYLLVVTDAFTKFCIVKAVRHTKTGPFINALSEIFGYFGLPLKIISDRGTSFTAKAFEKFCTDHNVKHIKTAVRTPRANGQVERSNGTILNILRTAQDQHRWDENLEKLQWMMNSQQNQTTKHSPNELVFSYNINDVVHNHLVAAMSENEEYSLSNDANIKNEDVLNNIATERAKWKRRFDNKHAPPTLYNKGDLVVIRNEMPATGESKKLEPRFRGPYIVVETLGNDRYVLADVPGMQLKTKPFKSVYAAHHMKPWCHGYPELLIEDDHDEQGEDEEEQQSEQ